MPRLRGRVVRDVEAAAAVGLAVKQQARPGRVAVDQPRLVEERGAHRAGGVEHDGLDQRAHAPAPNRARGDAAHLHGDGRLLARGERRDRPRLAAVARQVLEQLADRLEPERAQPGGDPLAGRPQRALEPRGPRPADRRGQQLLAGERLRGGERGSRERGGIVHPRARSHRGGRRRPLWCSRRHRGRIMLLAAVVTRAPARLPARPRRAAGWVTRRPAATSRRAGRRGAAPARPSPSRSSSSSPSPIGVPSPASTRDQLGRLAVLPRRRERGEDRLQRRQRRAPRHHLVGHEADRFAAGEPPLRVVARGGRHGARAHARESFGQRLCVLLDGALRRQRDGRREARLLAGRRRHEDLLVRELRRVLGGHEDVGAVRQHDDLLGGDVVDRREQVVGGGVERRAAVDRVHAELREHLAQPLAADRPRRRRSDPRGPRPRRPAPTGGRVRSARARCRRSVPSDRAPGADGRADPLVALGHLGAHVRHVEPRDLADAVEQRRRALGLVGVEVDLQRALVADHEHRVAERFELLDVARGAEARAGDGEVRAEPVRARAVLGVGDPGRRVVVQRRRVFAPQRGDDAREDDRQPVAAGVDDARVAQRREHLRAALDRVLPGVDGALQRDRDRTVLLAVLGAGRQARVLGGVRHVACDAVRHLARDGQHRALRRLADGRVGAVRGFREGGADQRRVDQLAGPRDELLGGAADQLGEDHAGVPARAEQGGARDRLHDLLAADLVDRPAPVAAVEAVELFEDGAQRQRHVVPGVAVGDREDVEVVDLLASRFQMGERAGHGGPEADQVGVGHRDTSITFRYRRPENRRSRMAGTGTATGSRSARSERSAPPRRRSALQGLGDLAGFEAARADVCARRRLAHHDADLLQVRVETPLGCDHGVAAAVPERRALPAAVADLGHDGAV